MFIYRDFEKAKFWTFAGDWVSEVQSFEENNRGLKKSVINNCLVIIILL